MRDTSKDIFVRHHIDFKLNAITHFQVQNEMMLVVLNGQTLLQIRLQNSRQINLKIPIELHDRIAHLHLDYSGVHGLVSTVAGENFYVNMRNGSLKALRRMKGHVVSAIAWNTEFNKDSETGFILVGTTKGSIYETNITSSGTIAYFKQLCANFSGKELSISGLHLHQLADFGAEYLLLICMPNRLYCLRGPANLQAASQQPSQPVVGTVWSSVMVEQSQETAVLHALVTFKGGKKPKYLSMCQEKENEVPPSALAVYPPLPDEIEPFKFVWLAADGLSVGKVDTDKKTAAKELPDSCDMLSVDININHRRSEGRLDYPLDVCLTEYHLLLLYTTRMAAISLFDRTLAFEDFYTGAPKIVGMCRDASSQLIWVISESAIFKYRPNDESRNVWRIFMDQNEFARAKKVANQLQDKRPFQTIIKKEAEKFIAEKNFVAAAESLAQSEEPFEKLVLLMLKDGPSSRNGLKRFLELKLGQIHDNEERTNRDMLVLWLLEVQLAELAELRKKSASAEGETVKEQAKGGGGEAANLAMEGGTVGEKEEAQIRRVKDQLYCFINRQIVFEAIAANQAAVYRMVSSHMDFDVQLYLAQKLRDHQTVIKILLMQKAPKDVLEILAKEGRPELFYEYSEELIREVPEELVTLLLKQEKALNQLRLLPAFQKCFDPELTNRAKIVEATFRFIERISLSTAPVAIVDFSIALYATFRPRELLGHLRKCVVAPHHPPQFDVGKAIQICRENGLSECRVYLLCVEGCYEEAVKLALTISAELAKKSAHELDEAIEQRDRDCLADFVIDEKGIDLRAGGRSNTILREMRKRVWLEIAKNMIQNGAPISQCLTILAESNGAIRIQEVLGHFPEFTKIEHFKEPLLECIKEYSNEIKDLQREIRDSTEMAEELRQEIDKSRSGFMVVRAGGQCSICKELLLQRPFVAFLCRHFFHRDCLESKTKEYSGEYANLQAEERILRKEVQLATENDGKMKMAKKRGGGRERGGKGEMASKKLESVRSRMRSLLCGDCPLCGLRTIEEVDQPFFDTPQEYLDQLKLWMP